MLEDELQTILWLLTQYDAFVLLRTEYHVRLVYAVTDGKNVIVHILSLNLEGMFYHLVMVTIRQVHLSSYKCISQVVSE